MAPPRLWSKVLHHPLKIGPWVGQTATSRAQKIGVEAEASREFLWKRLLEHGVFLGPLPCRGEKGLSQVRESSMSHSDDLTVSPGESVGQRPEVLFTPGKIQRRGQCLPRACQKTKKRSLCWEDTGHPVRCGVLHEAQAWAAGEGQPGTRAEAASRGHCWQLRKGRRWRKNPGGRWGVWGMHESAPRKN